MPTRLSSLRPAARLRAIFEEIQDINGQRASLGMALVDPFGGLDFGTAPAEAPAAVPFLSFPLRSPLAAQDQGELAFGTGGVRLPQPPFRQPPVPQRPLSPDDAPAANDRIDPNTLFALSAISGAQERAGVSQPADDQERAEQAAKRDKLRKRFDRFGRANDRVRAAQQRDAAERAARKKREEEFETQREIAKQAKIKSRSIEFAQKAEEQRRKEAMARGPSVPDRKPTLFGPADRLASEFPDTAGFVPKAVTNALEIKRLGLETPDDERVLRQALKAGEALGFLSNTTAVLASRLKQALPEARFKFDRDGDLLVDIDGQVSAINKKGFSTQDARAATGAAGVVGAAGLAALLLLTPPGLAFLASPLGQRVVRTLKIAIENMPPGSDTSAIDLLFPTRIEGRSVEELTALALGEGEGLETENIVEPRRDERGFLSPTDAFIQLIRDVSGRARNGRLRKADKDVLQHLDLDPDKVEIALMKRTFQQNPSDFGLSDPLGMS